MAYLRTRAIVLRCTDYSETSQVAAVCTPDLGQIHVLAKGARRPRKDGRVALDPLSHCDIVIARRAPGKLQLATDWSLRETFPALRQDLQRLWTAFYAGETVLASTAETAEDAAAYGHLVTLLRQLEGGGGTDLPLFLFLARLLKTAGWGAAAHVCAHCSGPLHGRTRFSPQSGGALCGGCAGNDPSGFAISRGALAVMGRLTGTEAQNPALKVSSRQAAEIRRAFNEQIQYHLGRPLRTARFLMANR